jgi:hypothetical protein
MTATITAAAFDAAHQAEAARLGVEITNLDWSVGSTRTRAPSEILRRGGPECGQSPTDVPRTGRS